MILTNRRLEAFVVWSIHIMIFSLDSELTCTDNLNTDATGGHAAGATGERDVSLMVDHPYASHSWKPPILQELSWLSALIGLIRYIRQRRSRVIDD